MYRKSVVKRGSWILRSVLEVRDGQLTIKVSSHVTFLDLLSPLLGLLYSSCLSLKKLETFIVLFSTGVWVLSTFSWKPLSSFSQNFCCESLRFFRPKNRELKVRGVSTGHGSQPESSVPTTSPLLIPVPVNSLATSYVTLGGGTNVTSQCHNHHRPFAGINTPRYHQPPLPPLPARNPDPIIHLDGWRRTETIV